MKIHLSFVVAASVLSLGVTLANVGVAQAASAASVTQARELLGRIASTRIPQSDVLVQKMAVKIEAGDLRGAADLAMTHKNFLNLTIKLMASRMSTREEENLPLNDFSAAFVGVTRDDLDARTLLTGNFTYRGDPAKFTASTSSPTVSLANEVRTNAHYSELEANGRDFGSMLMRVNQQFIETSPDAGVTKVVGIQPDPAGVLTSRSFLAAQADAGTNRRPVEYAFREFMCVPIDQWADATASDNRIGRDIDRFPGGDNNKFQTSCKACHTGMDGFRGAFAKVDTMNGANIQASTGYPSNRWKAGVSTKMSRNADVFSGGFVTTDSSFVNNARGPSNETLFGWRGPAAAGGSTLNDFGQLLANSKRFSRCMVKRVYDAVCKTDLDAQTNLAFLTQYGDGFEQSGYKFKYLVREISILPKCQSAAGLGGAQ